MNYTMKILMAISTNSLFHFTDKIENILNILEEGFKPHFCLETLGNGYELAIPIVCFCDIPLSQTKEHMNKYGYYGIGLSKKWGMKNKISPVIYAHKNSEIPSALFQLGKRTFKSAWDDNQSEEYFIKVFEDIDRINYFIKPYNGRSWRRGKYIKVHFYNEREWRFVPLLSKSRFRRGMTKTTFLNDSLKNEANNELWPQIILNFELKDIKYIIISKEAEIPHFIEKIERIKKYSKNEIKLLFSRVISAERIGEDF